MKYVLDFETRNEEPATVWLWVALDMESEEKQIGFNIKTCFDWMNSLEDHSSIYIHNLKFDGEFLKWCFLENNIEFVRNNKSLKKCEATTVISNLNEFYQMTYRNKKAKFIKLYDSYKQLPMRVEELPKAFGLEDSKGEIDYNKYRPINYIPTDNEIDYCVKDCKIVKDALNKFWSLTVHHKNTLSSASYEAFMNTLTPKEEATYFSDWKKYATIELDNEIRKSYRGGFCRVNPLYAGKILNNVYYYDVNSMYPYQMTDKRLPFGLPLHGFGQYKYDAKYPLYLQKIKVICEVKQNKAPTVLLNNGLALNQYLTTTKGEILELTLTNIDLKRFYKNYDIIKIEYIEYWKFMAKKGIPNKFILPLYEGKLKYKKLGNKPAEQVCKLQMNSVSGKFGENPVRYNRIPVKIENNKIIYEEYTTDSRGKMKYLPFITFITSYSREYIFKLIDKIGYKNWVYSDTDSIMSLISFEDKYIDNTELGKFKLETCFEKLKVIGPKTYLGTTQNHKKVVKVCGATEAIKAVDFDDFNANMVIPNGRRMAKRVKGGIKIVDAPFTIKERQTN